MACDNGQHKFQPRYTEIYSSVIEEGMALLSRQGVSAAKLGPMPDKAAERGLKEKRYIHDICVNCGTISKGDK